MIRQPPRCTLTYTHFPYTTRFRSRPGGKVPLVTRRGARNGLRQASAMLNHSSRVAILGYVGALFRRTTRIKPCARTAHGSPKCCGVWTQRSEEHTSELQSLMRISYAVFCLKQNHIHITNTLY